MKNPTFAQRVNAAIKSAQLAVLATKGDGSPTVWVHGFTNTELIQLGKRKMWRVTNHGTYRTADYLKVLPGTIGNVLTLFS